MATSIRKKISITVIVLAALGLVAGAVYAAYNVLNPTYVVAGRFVDADNGKPVENIAIKANGIETKTDKDGRYSITQLKEGTAVEILPPKEYLPPDYKIDYSAATSTSWNSKEIKKDYVLAITDEEKQARLRKDIDDVYNAYKSGNWDMAFDVMHPDSQQRFKKEDYIALNVKNFEGITITDYKIGNIKFLDKWKDEKTGKEYTNVAEADVSITGQIGAVSQTVNQPAHFVKHDNKWRWFSTL